jgi:hypothetical protein
MMIKRDRIGVSVAVGSLFFLWLFSLPIDHQASWHEAMLLSAFVLGFAAVTLPSFPHDHERRNRR